MSDDNFLNACPPPWLEFPHINPDELPRYLQQGLGEWWFDQIWRPFWNPLSREQRERYLDHWRAPEKWRESLYFVFPCALDYDPMQEMIEQEEYLRKRQTETAKSSLLARLFGFRK